MRVDLDFKNCIYSAIAIKKKKKLLRLTFFTLDLSPENRTHTFSCFNYTGGIGRIKHDF